MYTVLLKWLWIEQNNSQNYFYIKKEAFSMKKPPFFIPSFKFLINELKAKRSFFGIF